MTTAAVGQGVGTDGVFVGRQRHVDGAIANRMRHDLPAAGIEQAHQLVERVGVHRRRPGVRGVGVRREQRGGLRLDYAVELDLDGARLEERIVRIPLGDGAELADG